MEPLTTSRYFTHFTKLGNIKNGLVCIKAHLPLILKLDFTRAKKEHKKPNKECLSKAEQYGVGKMQDWQEEILEREGFNKTDKMKNTMEINWKDGTTTKEVDGKIVTTRNLKDIFNSLVKSFNADERPSFNDLKDLESFTQNNQAQEINANLRSIIG
jgi:hypothetical protein